MAKLSQEELEALAEFKDSLAYKLFSRFQEYQSQELKESALCLNDVHVSVKVGEQEHIQVIPVKEQLCELQGRQNQMITERSFINNAVKRLVKIREKKKV